jgi:hypothetical protein
VATGGQFFDRIRPDAEKLKNPLSRSDCFGEGVFMLFGAVRLERDLESGLIREVFILA